MVRLVIQGYRLKGSGRNVTTMLEITAAILFPLAVFAVLAVLAWLALQFGAESRPGFDERPEDRRFGSLR